MLDQGRGGEVARAQVAECAHFFAQLQETLLRADGAGAPFLFAELVVGGDGENGGGGGCTGPPMAPRRTASAFLAAVRASSVRGLPVASMEACIVVVSAFYGLVIHRI